MKKNDAYWWRNSSIRWNVRKDILYRGISVCISCEFLALIFGGSNFSDEDVIAIGRKGVDKITRARKMPEGRLLCERERERERGNDGCRGIGYQACGTRGGRGEEEIGGRGIGVGYVRFAKTRFARLICGLGQPSGRSRILLWKSKVYPIQWPIWCRSRHKSWNSLG